MALLRPISFKEITDPIIFLSLWIITGRTNFLIVITLLGFEKNPSNRSFARLDFLGAWFKSLNVIEKRFRGPYLTIPCFYTSRNLEEV